MSETSFRVLIVEDETIVALDIRSQLERLGYTVVGTAATARQACDLAQEREPDLVLMDIHLRDGSSGIDAAEEIGRDRLVPVVFLTAYADSETVARATNVEPFGYIVKPFNEQDLHTTIQIALHKGRAERVLRQSREDMLAILDAQRQGTILVDAEDRVTFLSRAARRMVGGEADDAAGRTWQQVLRISADEAERLRTVMEQPANLRSKVPTAIPRDSGDALHVEIEVQDDPRAAERKIFFLYDVSDLHQLRQKLDETARFEGIVGKSDATRDVVQLIENLAQVESVVLIEGESGTGKELVARAIHRRSRRRSEPFLALNCAGLNEELAASQLFGHRKGAFTGAVDDRAGMFEAAKGGTLFLDEIGELPLRVQTTLLRVLEEHAVMRLGDTQLRPVNPRIIAATNRDLSAAAAEGGFRSDLLYRIRVARVHLPSLRERREDIPLLVRVFLSEHAAVIGKAVDGVADTALTALMDYDWPGNVRELKNTLEFAVIRARARMIQCEDLPEEITERKQSPVNDARDMSANDEKTRILTALERAGGNRRAAADILGIARATLYRRMEHLGIR